VRGLEARARNSHNNESARLDIHSANAKDAEEFRLITIHTLLPTKKSAVERILLILDACRFHQIQKKKKTKPQAFAQKKQSRRIWTLLNNKMIKDLFVHHSNPTPCLLHEFQARRRTKTVTTKKTGRKKSFSHPQKLNNKRSVKAESELIIIIISQEMMTISR
jgi:hypothetical protein